MSDAPQPDEPPYDVVFAATWAAPLVREQGATGGSETQMVLLARELAARGLRIGLLVVGDKATLPRRWRGVDVLAQPPGPRARGLAGLVNDAGTVSGLLRTPARVVLKQNAGRSVAAARLAARLRRAAFVFSSSSLMDFEYERHGRRYNVRLHDWAMRTADEIVVQSAEQAELCRRRYGRDPVIIRNIAEPAEPRTGTPDAFLWIGRTAPYKRLDVYLDLARALPDIPFQVVAVPARYATPELTARLERDARELPNLEVLAPRPRAELAELVARAVAIVNTSDFEGMPNVFLECWSQGVPAIAYAHDPDRLVSEHGLGAFADGSFDRLVEIVREYWAARDDQEELAARCLRYVRENCEAGVVCAAWKEVIARVAR